MLLCNKEQWSLLPLSNSCELNLIALWPLWALSSLCHLTTCLVDQDLGELSPCNLTTGDRLEHCIAIYAQVLGKHVLRNQLCDWSLNLLYNVIGNCKQLL